MQIATGILIYVITWWMIFFMVLPMGVHAQNEDEKTMVKGSAPSAPQKPMMVKKLLITTVLAAIVWAIIVYVIDSGAITMRNI